MSLLTFETVEERPRALLEFRETNNTIWLIVWHGVIAPVAARQSQPQPVAPARRTIQRIVSKCLGRYNRSAF